MSTDQPTKKPMNFVVRNNRIIPLTKNLVKRIKNLRPELFVNTEEDESDLYDDIIKIKKENRDDDSISSNENESRLGSPNTLNMSRIILDNQKLKERQKKIEHNIDNRLTELNNEIKKFRAKIKKLEEKRHKYESMKNNYTDTGIDKFCSIL